MGLRTSFWKVLPVSVEMNTLRQKSNNFNYQLRIRVIIDLVLSKAHVASGDCSFKAITVSPWAQVVVIRFLQQFWTTSFVTGEVRPRGNAATGIKRF